MTIEAVLLAGTTPDRETQVHLEALASLALAVRTLRRHGARSIARTLEALWAQEGLRPSEVLVLDACGRCPLPGGAVRLRQEDAASTLAALQRQRAQGVLPAIPGASPWTIEVLGAEPAKEHIHDTWLVMVDGVIGTLGSPLAAYAPARRGVLVAGVYSDSGPDSDLLRVPDWTHLAGELTPDEGMRRVLDLRSGLLHHEARSTSGPFRALSFASRALPGVGVMRALGQGARPPRGSAFLWSGALIPGAAPAAGSTGDVEGGALTGVETYSAPGEPGGVAAAIFQSTSGRASARRLERLAAHVADSERRPSTGAALARLRRAQGLGINRLISGQRSAWSRRWQEMGIRIEGDPELQRALNFALFHLDASVARQRQAPLGPRGLSGPSYKGHVFWDSEVFILPFFAATRPAAARAMLEYRVRRLGAAQAAAREAGLAGAWYPWESAADGRDVTPPWVPGSDTQPIRVWTGERELHIVAAIAWATLAYVAWSGDEAFAHGDGRRLLVETARFWASRLERDEDGTVHLRGIIGPDEYHELVDDNAYTNVMARWNLRAAARAVQGAGMPLTARHDPGAAETPDDDEIADWLDVADRIVDGYDPGTRLYEQFAGFHALEPIRIAELAPRPAWADVLLGRERVAHSQVVKQTDVLLLHHLVPDEVAPGSLESNLDYYEPRTAHGSSLSPGTHAALLARAGRFDGALDALRMAAFMDLDDRNGTASEGLHIPTMGGLWQALVMGFAGIRPVGDVLAVDPRLAPGWELLEVPLRFLGRQVRITLRPGIMTVRSSAPVTLEVPGAGRLALDRRAVELRERDGLWTRHA